MIELPDEDEKLCLGCNEYWPDDSEFFRTDQVMVCIACEKEIRDNRPVASPLTLKRDQFEAQMQKCREARQNAQRLKQGHL